MSNVCISIDELVSGLSDMRLNTLIHAAEISPFVTERTLGPDLPEYCNASRPDRSIKYKENEPNVTPEKKVSADMQTGSKGSSYKKQTTPKDKQTSKTPPEKVLSPNSSNFQHLDYESINNSILLREAELQRRKSIRQQVVDMQEKSATIKQQSAEKKRQLKEENDQWLAEKRRSDSYIIAEAEKQAARQQQENEQNLKTLRQQTQRQLQLISFHGISQYHNKFRAKYENVARLLMSIDKQELLACEEYNRRLKELIPQFEQLIGKIKAGECGATELRDAENLCKSLDALEDSIIKALENIVHQEEQRTLAAKNQEQEQQRKQQEELLQQQQQQQQQEAAAAAAAANAVTQAAATAAAATVDSQNQPLQTQLATKPSITDATDTATAAEATAQYVSAERFAFYTQINTFYQEKVERVKPLQTDENMKKYRFACQKAINIPVNAISAVSPQHLKDKFEKLYNFISGQPLKTSEGQMVSVNDHPLGRDYCTLLMAKKFVNQGDTAISSNPQAAFPVAAVIVSLWKLVPDFGQIFLAYTFKESPFLVPYFIPQKRSQAVEDYYKVLGYRVTNGQLEQQDLYLKRQAGIARLYAAVMITSGRQMDGPQHPYAIEHAWRWLTNFIALAPLPDICATLIMEVLQTVGADMWAAYGKQFVKLLIYIQQDYFAKLSSVDEGGPKARLELLLGKFLREGQIPRAQGVLPAGFW